MLFRVIDWHNGAKLTPHLTYEGYYVAGGELVVIFANDHNEAVVLPSYLFEEVE